MYTYPSISKNIQSTPIYAFDKLDGSNIRVEWTRKNGFVKYGTRTRLLDPNEHMLGESVEIFETKYANDLDRIFRKDRLEKATAFLEFYGENSFSGLHQEEQHDLMLFDIHIHKQGMLPPKHFLSLVGGKVETAPLLYKGNPNEDFLQSVKERTLKGMTYEGVVCKGNLDSRGRPVTFKVKSHDWINAVTSRYSNNPKLLEDLL